MTNYEELDRSIGRTRLRRLRLEHGADHQPVAAAGEMPPRLFTHPGPGTGLPT